MVLDIIILFIIFLLLILLSMVWPPDSPWSPWWRTSDDTIQKAFKLARLGSKDTIYDLGSGDGRTLIIAAKEFKARAIGIEIDPLRFYISKLLIWFNSLSNKVEIRKENFLKSNFSDATVIFVYLVPKALERLKPKLLEQLKKGTRIVSVNYEISLQKTKTIKVDKKTVTLYLIS